MSMKQYEQYVQDVTHDLNVDIEYVIKAYSEPHRHFHTLKHVVSILENIAYYPYFKDDRERNSMAVAALYHDIVYVPWAANNELNSICVFEERVPEGPFDRELVRRLIAGSAQAEAHDHLCDIFNGMDRAILKSQNLHELMEYGDAIWKEYSFNSYADFLEGHFKLIRTLPEAQENLSMLKQYEIQMRKKHIRVGLYVGSFNPFHNGHLDILHQAEVLFDKVVVAVGVNPKKIKELNRGRIPVQKCEIQGVPRRFEQVSFNGMLHKYAESLQENCDVTIVRGFRDERDIQSELTQRKYILERSPDLKYVFLSARPGMEHISSSAIRSLQMFDEDVSHYLPTPTINWKMR